MSDGRLTISGRSDFRRLLSDYNKLDRENLKLQNRLDQVGKRSRKAERSQSNFVRNIGRNAKASIASYVSLLGALRLVTNEIEKQKELGRKALTAEVQIADAEIQLRSALGPKIQNEAARALVGRVRKLGRQTGFGEADMLREFGEAFSASEGPVNRQRIGRVEGLVRAAEPLFRAPSLRGELSDFVGAALDLKKGLPSMSDREALGVMLALRSQSRITETAQLKNLVPAAVAGQVTRPNAPRVATTLESLSLTAALGGRIGDPTGETTSTAGAALLSVMAKVAPEFNKLPPIQALLEIQKDPAIKEQFKKEVMGRMRTKPVQKEMVEGLESFLTAESILPELVVTPKEMNRFLRDMERGSPELRATSELRKAGTQNLARAMTRQGVTKQARALLFGGQVGDEEIMGALDASTRQSFGDAFGQLAARVGFDVARLAGLGPARAAAQAIGAFHGARVLTGRADETAESDFNRLIGTMLQIRNLQRMNVDATQSAAEANAGVSNAASQTKVHAE